MKELSGEDAIRGEFSSLQSEYPRSWLSFNDFSLPLSWCGYQMRVPRIREFSNDMTGRAKYQTDPPSAPS